MRRSADYVILGAGIAGMTVRHLLRDASVVLLDGAPGRYKIGESIIPQHFVEPEVRPLYDIVRQLPSATPKDGTLFIDDRSIGGFELLDTNRTIHVVRADLEAATAEFFGTEVVRERVESVDVGSRTVTTEAGTFAAKELVIDCSGPARLVSRALGLAREVWPVWASWAYHDVLDTDDERLFDVVRRGEKEYFRYSERLRRAVPSRELGGFRPSCCTTLTQVGDGTWTWQIPLFRGTRLGVGVVSRHGPVDETSYRERTERSIAPQFRTRLRPWDGSGPFNTFHVRNRFAWAADRFAGDGWALVGDAAFFGDPVYSVGTGFATNHAIQLGRALRERGWSEALARAHHERTADLYARAKKAYDGWYFGRVVRDGALAEEVQNDFLTGRAFQVQTIHAYSEMWLVSHPQDTWHAADPGRGEDVTGSVARLLGEGQTVAGWTLATASAFGGRLELEWRRPDAKPLVTAIERARPDRPSHRTIGPLGVGYRRTAGEVGNLDGQERALVDALVALVEAQTAAFEGLVPQGPETATAAATPPVGSDVLSAVAPLLGPEGALQGWKLVAANVQGGRLELSFEAERTAKLGLVLQRAMHGQPYYKTYGALGLRYRRPDASSSDLDPRGRALVEAFGAILAREVARVEAILDAGPVAPAAASGARGEGHDRGAAVQRVGVLGGGTAGYLTAIALRRRYPAIEVTLVESSRVPIIGVGEASTPDLVAFLHESLGVDPLELYREVRPTWKLGIRFEWGLPGDHVFHHPFTGEHLLEAWSHAHDQDLQSLGAQLMRRRLAPVLRTTNGKLEPLLASTAYAYHLDNARFVAFLEQLAHRTGVKHVDATVDDVAVGEGGRVTHLGTSDGNRLSFDLYVDATGFRSILLEKALRVPFRSFASSLFTDAAVVADVPHAGPLDPFTRAETMDAGWCWNIPQRESNHRGYVFASSALSADRAEAEMRAKNPGMGEARLVRFRSGRLERCWVGNAIAVGNAHAFVEPLESTGLHMLVHTIRLLLDAIAGPGDDAARATLNDAVASHWDRLRGFLALHYRFNRKLETPFWKECRSHTDLAAGEAMLAAYRDGAPLVARPDRRELEDHLFRSGYFGLLGVDNVLLGQGVPARFLTPSTEGIATFEAWAKGLPALLARALSHEDALDAYEAWLSDPEKNA